MKFPRSGPSGRFDLFLRSKSKNCFRYEFPHVKKTFDVGRPVATLRSQVTNREEEKESSQGKSVSIDFDREQVVLIIYKKIK
jgi:hypothetical protein